MYFDQMIRRTFNKLTAGNYSYLVVFYIGIMFSPKLRQKLLNSTFQYLKGIGKQCWIVSVLVQLQ